MQVTINGEARSVPDNLSVHELIQHLKLKEDRVAVERNRAIIKRESWSRVQVEEGDELEIVQFVGGGQGRGFAKGFRE